MNAPVHFKQTGIEELISRTPTKTTRATATAGLKDERRRRALLGSDFRMPSAGGALYHESNYTLGAGASPQACASTSSTPACATAATDTVHQNRHQKRAATTANRHSTTAAHRQRPLPKCCRNSRSVLLRRDAQPLLVRRQGLQVRRLQHPDILRRPPAEDDEPQWASAKCTTCSGRRLRTRIQLELRMGGHFLVHGRRRAGRFRTVLHRLPRPAAHRLPPGQTTGRMMTNAGRTRSLGAEAAVQFRRGAPRHQLALRIHRRPFRRVKNDGDPWITRTTASLRPAAHPSAEPHGPSHGRASGSAIWSCRPASAARAASGGTRRIRFRTLLCA